MSAASVEQWNKSYLTLGWPFDPAFARNCAPSGGWYSKVPLKWAQGTFLYFIPTVLLASLYIHLSRAENNFMSDFYEGAYKNVFLTLVFFWLFFLGANNTLKSTCKKEVVCMPEWRKCFWDKNKTSQIVNLHFLI